MSFKLSPTPLFEKELKKLSKKYTSIKSDLSAEIAALLINPTAGRRLGIIVTKYGWQYLQKTKVNQAGQG